MEGIIGTIIGDSVKLYALMTPPAVLSAFIGYTEAYTPKHKRGIALKTSAAIFIFGVVLYVWGSNIFELFGFTLDAFRIGSGTLLMLTAVSLMQNEQETSRESRIGDISIVPLAIPLGMGPASIGAVMVMGASVGSRVEMAVGVFSLFLAAVGMYVMLLCADVVGKILHRTGIEVLAKLTGLLLAAIAAQVIFTGIVGFFGPLVGK